MIIVELSSGLGNQMSNYAFARLLKTVHPNADVRLYIGNYNTLNEHNGFELDRVFSDLLKDIPVVSNFDYWRIAKRIPYFSPVFHKRIMRGLLSVPNKLIGDILMIVGNDPLIYEEFGTQSKWVPDGIKSLSPEQNYVFRGLWLNYHYSEIMPLLRENFRFKTILSEKNVGYIKKIHESNSIAVHLRRGDYLNSNYNDELNILTKEYYIKAIKIICEKIDDPTFFFFSDDLDYAAKFAKQHVTQYELVQGNIGDESYMDMYLITLCKHFILANSSFSYWGCLLGRSNDSIVVCPDHHGKSVKMWDVPGFTMLDTSQS